MIPVLMLVLLGALVMSVALMVVLNQQRKENWALVARSLNIAYVRGTLVGRVDGVQVLVAVEKEIQQPVTVFKAEIEGGLPASLLITPQGVVAKGLKLLSSEDVHLQLGLPDLDPKLMVRAKDGQAVQDWARLENVAEGLRQLINLRAFRLEPTMLSFEIRGAISDPKQLELHIQELVSVAQLISPSTALLAQEPDQDEGVLR